MDRNESKQQEGIYLEGVGFTRSLHLRDPCTRLAIYGLQASCYRSDCWIAHWGPDRMGRIQVILPGKLSFKYSSGVKLIFRT
jgi:hypothetical protein